MRFTFQWVSLILATTAADLLVRFGVPGGHSRVLWVEAILFPLAGIALHLVFRSRPRPSGLKSGLQTTAVWAYLLAGIRSGLWAAGFPVAVANLAVLLLALLGWLGSRLMKEKKAGQK